jgi:hypothetical protein
MENQEDFDIPVLSFMRKDSKLMSRPYALLIYAMIYSCSKKNASFSYSANKISDILNIDRVTVFRNISWLILNKYIVKSKMDKCNSYDLFVTSMPSGVTPLGKPSASGDTPLPKAFTSGDTPLPVPSASGDTPLPEKNFCRVYSKDTYSNTNTDKNTDTNKDTNTTTNKEKDARENHRRNKIVANNSVSIKSLEEIVEDKNYHFSQTVKKALFEFIEMRCNAKKARPTQFAMKLICQKLNKLSDDENTQVSIVEQSIVNNWTDIYPIRNGKQQIEPSASDSNKWNIRYNK